jgi:PTS system trehalose-specific IIC component
MTNAIDLQLIADFGGTMLWPMIALSNIAQGSAVLGMIFLQKKNEDAQEVNVPSCISCYLGVTEPAIFGVNLKYMFPFVCAMSGSAMAAIFSVLTGVEALSIGVGGLPGIISIFPQYMGIFAVAMLVALVVPFVLTVLYGRNKIDPETGELYEEAAEEEAAAAAFTEAQKNEDFAAVASGKVMPVSEVEDQVFASRAMGDGIAIDPSEGKIYAPYSGKITVAFPTGHAYGMETAGGKEVLIHIGMDTVELNGKGFEPAVKQGDTVKQGDLLTEVDLDYIRSQGKPVITPVIFTDGTAVELVKRGEVKAKETGIIKLN